MKSGIEKDLTTNLNSYSDTQHFNYLYENIPKQYAFQAGDQEELLAWQGAFRPKLREVIGLNNIELDLAGYMPKAERLEAFDMGSHVRETWRLWVEPTVPLPFYLLLIAISQGKPLPRKDTLRLPQQLEGLVRHVPKVLKKTTN